MPHFRRSAIEDTGCWDPYNVTEDADLGFRMWRAGYRIGLLTRPTLEDAPDNVEVWLKQRTRWLKGWMQTWVVRTRRVRPFLSGRRLAGALVMHVLLAGTVICALFYPFTLLTIFGVALWSLSTGAVPASFSLLSILDWSSIALGFTAHAALCLCTVDRPLRILALKSLPAIPLYWTLGAVAGWRAVRQYFAEPFLWEKTPHKAHDRNGAFHHRQSG